MTYVLDSEEESDIDQDFTLRLIGEYNEIRSIFHRFTCTDDSAYKKDILKHIANGDIIIEHIEPFIPSYNEKSLTFVYDFRLTDEFLLRLEFDML